MQAAELANGFVHVHVDIIRSVMNVLFFYVKTKYLLHVYLCTDCFDIYISFLIIDMDNHRLATVLQENAVLKSEVEMLKMKYKTLLEENRRLKQASVNIVSVTINRIV